MGGSWRKCPGKVGRKIGGIFKPLQQCGAFVGYFCRKLGSKRIVERLKISSFAGELVENSERNRRGCPGKVEV